MLFISGINSLLFLKTAPNCTKQTDAFLTANSMLLKFSICRRLKLV